MESMAPMIPQSRRFPVTRNQPYLIPKRRGGVGLTSGPIVQTQDQFQHYTSEGEFVSWGWLSAHEVQQSLKKLHLDCKVTLQVASSAFCELPHIPEGKAVMFLIKGHYICVCNVKRKLVFFDPLGYPAQMYFGFAVKQLCAVGMQVQHSSSTLCGNFCLFFLHMLYRCCNVHRHSKETVIQPIRDALQKFLYVMPQDIHFNNMLMEHFTADFKLGEEWGPSAGRYKRMRMYDSCLSSRQLGL
uniref:LO8 n=1 Tax=Carp adomavirus TaxID=2609874 RepID=A0A6F9EZE2_9VIRU|nr:TPA_asm: LO8 [Carp adomavirus]